MNLRDSWLLTGATQADVYRIIEKLFKRYAITFSTLKEHLKPGVRALPEPRTLAQINRAFAEIRKENE